MDRRPVAAAAALLLVSTWMFNSGDSENEIYGFLPIVIGMTVLVIALAQLVLWALNRAPDAALLILYRASGM
jgi:glycerol uptake facilitator-like aquaporin